jgi:hypothetical protein
MLKRLLKIFAFLIITLLLSILAFIFTVYLVLFFEVRDICNLAQKEYKSDCVTSLLKVLDDNEKTIKQKNDAIWTLGQLADERALEKLENMFVADYPEREPLDKVISSYEIEKAIRWIQNGNLTSWMYFSYR